MQPSSHARVCPTRIDAAPALFAHRVSVPRCAERQRVAYHKCYACAWSNAHVAAHGLPDAGRGRLRPPAVAALPPDEPAPARTARAV